MKNPMNTFLIGFGLYYWFFLFGKILKIFEPIFRSIKTADRLFHHIVSVPPCPYTQEYLSIFLIQLSQPHYP
jgi:hypothetical protein